MRKVSLKSQYKIETNKILSLSGYSSGLILLFFAFVIAFQAIKRFINPESIHFKEAILVACTGLVVIVISALLLKHKHKNTDHNIKAAYLHVIADALTSVTAILGLIAATIWNIIWIDALGAIISSLVIIKWSIGLLKDSARILVDIRFCALQ